MIAIQLNLNDHLFIFIFLIALSFVAVGLHTVTLLDSLLQCNNNELKSMEVVFISYSDLAVVVFPDRPGDVLIKKGEMLQQTGQSVTENI